LYAPGKLPISQIIANLEKKVLVCPSQAVWHHNLAVGYTLAGRCAEAVAAFESCFALDSDHVEAHIHYPTALLEAGEVERAVAAARRSLRSSRDSSQLHRTLGRALAELGQIAEAVDAFLESLRLDPENPKTLSAAFAFFFDAGEESLAAQCGSGLAQAFSDQSAAWLRCGSAHVRTGELQVAVDAYRKALEIASTLAATHSVLVYVLLMDQRETPASLLAAHRDWAARHCVPSGLANLFPNSPDPNRRLRIGILSGELVAGSGSHFLPPILRNHDRERFELFAYSANPFHVESNPYRPLFDHWHDVGSLTDDEIEAAIRHDTIDILVDVSGHLPHRRLTVFGRKPAPIQIAYPRYPGTTGVSAIEYRLTDEWTDPTGQTEDHYCEKLLRLPGGHLAYEPPEITPRSGPLPALRNGYVTFSFFQTPLKLNSDVLDSLASILANVDNSRLLIHYAVNDFDRPGRHARERILQALAERNIDPARLTFRGPLPLYQHLGLVAETDIALDSFPYSGQTTTCECLWMGVPVVTLAGDRHAGRVSAAILRRAKLDDWVAESVPEYIAIAARKASSVADLSALRNSLRNQFASSPVMDGARVAREIEAAYRSVWQEWCNQSHSPH